MSAVAVLSLAAELAVGLLLALVASREAWQWCAYAPLVPAAVLTVYATAGAVLVLRLTDLGAALDVRRERLFAEAARTGRPTGLARRRTGDTVALLGFSGVALSLLASGYETLRWLQGRALERSAALVALYCLAGAALLWFVLVLEAQRGASVRGACAPPYPPASRGIKRSVKWGVK